MSNSSYTDPNLQVVSINDFTPGIINSPETFVLYPTEAPLGSASVAFRCYSRPNIGLTPLPDHAGLSQIATKSYTPGVSAGTVLTLADMIVLPLQASTTPNYYGSLIFCSWSKDTFHDATSPGMDVDFISDSPTGIGAITNLFFQNIGSIIFGTPNLDYWPNLARYYSTQLFFVPVVGVTSFVPKSSTIVEVPSANTAVTSKVVTLPTSPNIFPVSSAFVTSRMTFIVTGNSHSDGSTAPLSLFSGVYTSDVAADTNINNPPNFFVTDIPNPIGSWGSISTGEFLIVNQNGGGVVVNGDIQNPSSAISLPGVTGTGQAVGPACPSPIGLIYATDFDGVWVWNGGNTALKISNALPDNSFTRASLSTMTSGAVTTALPVNGQSNVKCWTDWVFFPNNWMYDTLTNAWWRCEDPNVINFQVYAGQASHTTKYFYASPGSAGTTTGAGVTVPIYRFDSTTRYSTFTWISNPIPVTYGSLSSLQSVEIVASNTTAQGVKVTVTPTVPTGQTPFPNQNPTQPLVFNIPANTVGWKGLLRSGYTDYNIMIQVVADSTTFGVPAPTIHEINLGISRVRTSGV